MKSIVEKFTTENDRIRESLRDESKMKIDEDCGSNTIMNNAEDGTQLPESSTTSMEIIRGVHPDLVNDSDDDDEDLQDVVAVTNNSRRPLLPDGCSSLECLASNEAVETDPEGETAKRVVAVPDGLLCSSESKEEENVAGDEIVKQEMEGKKVVAVAVSRAAEENHVDGYVPGEKKIKKQRRDS